MNKLSITNNYHIYFQIDKLPKKLSHKLSLSLDNTFERENGIALQKLVYNVAFKKPPNEIPHV